MKVYRLCVSACRCSELRVWVNRCVLMYLEFSKAAPSPARLSSQGPETKARL